MVSAKAKMKADETDAWLDEVAADSHGRTRWHKGNPEVLALIERVVAFNATSTRKVTTKATQKRLFDLYGVTVSASTLKAYATDVLGKTWNGVPRG